MWAVAIAASACIAVLIVATTGGRGVACSASVPMAPAADASTSGKATYYTLSSGGIGNCSLSAPADNLYVAVSPGEYGDGNECGSYLQVQGPKGSIQVKVIDKCPGCAAGHVDLSKTAFEDIGDLSQGIIPISYSLAVDPQLPGPLTAKIKSGSSQYWLAVMIDDIGNPLARVQASSAGGGMHDLSRTSYNYWIAASGLGPGPFTIVVTDNNGHTAQFSGITLTTGTTQTTSVWMYGGATTAPAVPTTTAPATPTPTPTPSLVVTTPVTTPAGSPSPTQTLTAVALAGAGADAGRC